MTICDSCAQAEATTRCTYALVEYCRPSLCDHCAVVLLGKPCICFECYREFKGEGFVSIGSLRNVFTSHVPRDLRPYELKMRKLQQKLDELKEEKLKEKLKEEKKGIFSFIYSFFN